MSKAKSKVRCSWADSHELLTSYHDKEWGVPVHDDRQLFEMINLEGAQAGLSWLTVLKKRENYREAFANFEAKKLLKFDAAKQAKLMQNEGIIRNRLKIRAVVENARAFLEVQREFGSFDKYIWDFVGGKPLQSVKDSGRAPGRAPGIASKKSTAVKSKDAVEISETMSKALKKRGFRFVGPTICFAFMQAAGLLNDHTDACFRRKAVTRAK